MKVWNVTQSTSGYVTGVTDDALTVAGVTWNNGDQYKLSKFNTRERSSVELALNIAVTDIDAVLHAADQCGCNWALWATNYVKKLNIIDGMAYLNNACGNPRFSDDLRMKMLEWVSGQLENIAKSIITICDGDTGAGYPAVAFAAQSWTPQVAGEIIINDELVEIV